MSKKNTYEITEELKQEVLTYWRDTVKDRNALCRTADLFGLREEDVKRIIAVRWREKFVWDEDNIFRLKAYLAQGMKITEIAKQLGCKPQVIYDFRRRNKIGINLDVDEASAFIATEVPEDAVEDEVMENSAEEGIAECVVDGSSDTEGCEMQGNDGSDKGEITEEMYNSLYTRYMDEWNKNERASGMLLDLELILKTAKYAGIQWCEVHGSYGNELSDCCRMYDMLISRAIENVGEVLKALENEND